VWGEYRIIESAIGKDGSTSRPTVANYDREWNLVKGSLGGKSHGPHGGGSVNAEGEDKKGS